ncbi:MAG: TonB-dependent receptor [Nitritalea sp.]
MKKYVLCCLLGLLQWTSAWAQHSLQGTVYDGAGQPLAGASLMVLGEAPKGQISDAEGQFRFQALAEGKIHLQVSFIGFKTQRIEVQLPRSSPLTITLEEQTFTTEAFVVYGTRASELVPTTFQNIDKQELGKLNLGQDLPMLLNYTPSVVTFSDAGAGIGYTGLRIRGSDQTRINVTLNGIPLNDAESHGVFWVNMPDFASSVESIQIQRGVGTSTNGAATFGASLNIQTDVLEEEAYAEVDNGVGSFGTLRHTVKAGTGLLADRWAMDVRLSRLTSDGYIDRASSDMRAFFVSGGYYGDKHMLKVNIFSGQQETYQAWEGVPEHLLATQRTFNPYTYDNQVDNYQQDHYQLIYTGQLAPNWNAHAALHYTYGRGYFEQFRPNDRLRNYGLPALQIGGQSIERMDIIRRRWLDNDFYGAVYSLNYVSDDGRLDAIVGGGANRYVGDHFGELIWMQFAADNAIRDRYYDNVATKDDVNVYAKFTYEWLPRFHVFGDLQWRGIGYTFEGINNDLRDVSGEVQFSFWNPKAGFSYLLSDRATLYASYAVANREPVRRDFTDSPIVDRAPRPERMQNVEAGIRAKSGRWNYEATFYLMDYRDQLVLTGQVNDVGAYVRDNVDNSYRAGIELMGGYALSSKWRVGGNAAFSRNKIREFTAFIDDFSGETFRQEEQTFTQTTLAFSPDVVAAGNIDFEPIKGLELNLFQKYVGSQFLDNTMNTDRMLQAFWTTDLRASYRFQTGILPEVTATFMVYNLFNRLYEPNGYTFSYFLPDEGPAGRALVTENFFYPMAGTNFLASLQVRF